MCRMTAEVQRLIAFSVEEMAASASCHFEDLVCVSQLVNFHALSSSVLNRCRLCSCEGPDRATLQMWSVRLDSPLTIVSYVLPLCMLELRKYLDPAGPSPFPPSSHL